MGEAYNGIKYARSKAKVSGRTCWLTFAREFATYKCNDVKNRHLHRPSLRTLPQLLPWRLVTLRVKLVQLLYSSATESLSTPCKYMALYHNGNRDHSFTSPPVQRNSRNMPDSLRSIVPQQPSCPFVVPSTPYGRAIDYPFS